jgi:DNA-binding NarL/FixJ family response regulator
VTVRVLIADDQQLVRSGFQMILSAQDDVEVVGEASTGTEAVSLTARLTPDVVLMDIRMPDLDGIEATRRIVAAHPEATVRVVILTTFDLDEYVYNALLAGASGFLLKDVPPEQLVTAVRMAALGDALLTPSVARRLITEFTRAAPASAGASKILDALSPRELEVLRLLATGLSNREIAGSLVVGESTVKTHVARILNKLQVRDRVQAVIAAYDAGLAVAQAPVEPVDQPRRR